MAKPKKDKEVAPTPAPATAPHAPGALAPRPRPGLLLPVVFTSGAMIMAVEIVGVRFLAPFFGVSVYVWGSILTVFMAALAAGYWLGGKIADAIPRFTALNLVALCGALTAVAVPYLSNTVCAPLEDLGERWGPFFASVALFFIPSMFLAMVSPYAVRLATSDVARVGHSAGRLYAFSTMGSIFGSWLTTFVLIGAISLTKIVLGCAGFLSLLAAINLLIVGRGRVRVVAVPALLIAMAPVFLPDAAGAWQPESGQTLVVEAETPYHRILVVDDESDAYADDRPTRSLHFDRFKESGILLEEPHFSTSRYTDGFHIAGALVANPRRALFIGAGGGLGPRSFRRRWPEMEIDVVDIDAKVLELCQEYFFVGAETDPKMHMIAADGRTFVHRKHKEMTAGSFDGYDFVVLDAFTIGGRIPWHLVTREFFSEIRGSLNAGGVLIMNVIGSLGPGGDFGDKSIIFRSIFKTMQAAYEPNDERPYSGLVYAFPINYTPLWKEKLDIARNIILVAWNSGDPIPVELFVEQARRFDQTGVIGKEIASIAADMLDPESTAQIVGPKDRAPLLTDEYCPVETMPFYNR